MLMDVQSHINNSDLLPRLKKLKARQFSDIVDDAGNQYVDLVMEGGGMLGIALVGYTWALENAGIRFLGIGGTSAGSINAMLLAALGTPGEAKSPKILSEMANKNFYDFVDGDDDARNLIKAALGGAGWVKLAFFGAQNIDNLVKNLGLNPGEAFVKWMADILKRAGITTLEDLNDRMQTLPAGLRYRDGKPITTLHEAGIKLAIVAADVATETKVIFPYHAPMYFRKANAVNPARFVRASMSIPFFFEPMRLSGLPNDDAAIKLWTEVGYFADGGGGSKQTLPKDAVFVDGGIMSNFPIDLFHDTSKVPSAPTFGVKLQLDNRRHDITNPGNLLGAIFDSARHCLDYDFIKRNPDYTQLITWIPCRDFNWLDFAMDTPTRERLFMEGAQAAVAFLEQFNWKAYKAFRAHTLGK